MGVRRERVCVREFREFREINELRVIILRDNNKFREKHKQRLYRQCLITKFANPIIPISQQIIVIKSCRYPKNKSNHPRIVLSVQPGVVTFAMCHN